jgi:hypothetical protein
VRALLKSVREITFGLAERFNGMIVDVRVALINSAGVSGRTPNAAGEPAAASSCAPQRIPKGNRIGEQLFVL